MMAPRLPGHPEAWLWRGAGLIGALLLLLALLIVLGRIRGEWGRRLRALVSAIVDIAVAVILAASGMVLIQACLIVLHCFRGPSWELPDFFYLVIPLSAAAMLLWKGIRLVNWLRDH